MSLLMMMPTWEAPSELWLVRMREMLRGELGVLACYEAPVKVWEGIEVVDLGRRADEASIERGRGELLEAMRRKKVDRALAHYASFALRYERELRAAGRVWVHVHGYDVTWDLKREGRPVHEAGYRQRVVEMGRWARVIANSRFTAGRLEREGISGVEWKYFGVPVGDGPKEHQSGRLRLLYLGRMVDFKGPVEVVRAVGMAAGLDVEMVMAGDGPVLGAVRQEVARLGLDERVKVIGAVDATTGEELRRWADVFVGHHQVGPESGQEEAFGVAVAEAMGAGLVVCTGRSGSMPELIEHERTGILVDSGDVAGQAGWLRRLADAELRGRLGRAAWEVAGRLFTVEAEKVALRRILGF